MKKTNWKFIYLGGVIFTIMISIAPSQINAQIVAPTLPDQTLTSIANWEACTPCCPVECPNPNPTLNCDMIETYQGLIKTIVWDDHTTQPWGTTRFVYFWVQDYNGNTIQQTIPVPNAYDPDVVLADDMNNRGVKYKLAIVFRQGNPITTGGNVHLRIFNLTNVGTAGFAATPASANIISTTATSSPHIDMWADNLTPISGKPSLHRFVMGWSDAGSQNLFLTNEILTPTLTPPFGVGIIVGEDPDVAAYTNVASNQKHIVVANKTGSILRQFDYNQTTGFPSPPIPLAGNAVRYPRIEAMSLWNPQFAKATKWQIVSVLTSGAVKGWTIGGFNNNASYLLSNIADSVDHLSPAVAAGIGLSNTGNVANKVYITGYHRVANNNIYTREINAANGALNSPNYYQVNTGFISGGHEIHYAVSSSSNSGRQILSVWHDNNSLSNTATIFYKLSPNAVAFKTTGIENVQTIQPVKLYPNPATNTLTLSGLNNDDASYSIIDVAGKIIQTGRTDNHTIAIDRMPSGMYTLRLKNGNNTTVLKFTKQ